MPQVYNLTDDNLSPIHSPHPFSSFNGALKTMTTRATTTTTTTANNRLPSNPPLSPLISSHSNSIHSPTDKDVHMLSPKDELISTASETSRSGSMTREGGEDVNMDETTTTRTGTPGRETIMENGGGSVDEKHSEIISLLPISVTSDPGSVPATPATDDDDDKITVRTFINNNGAADAQHAKPRSSSAAASVNGASADEKSKKPASAAVKPKSKRRSPSPEPPPTRPRMQTIRLEIPLGGPDNYAIDVLNLSKETGQRPPTPPPIKRDDESSESEGDGEGEGEGAAGPSTRAKGKGRGKAGKRNHVAEYYDINDPFIDDSELALDERTYFAQTKQQGFYVSSGEVALLKDKSHKEQRGGEGDGNGNGNGMSPSKKPKSRRNLVPTIIPLAGSQAVNAAVASSAGFSTSVSAPPPPPPHSQSSKSPTDPFNSQLSTGPGTRETPITLSDTEEGRAAASASASAPPYASISTTASNSNSSSTPAPTNGIVSNGITANDSVSMLKRKASETTANGKKKRKTVEIESFHPELQTALYELKEAISRESFEQKGKFPPSLKPILARTALKAILVGEYNDHFFALMPKLFIYNKFTMTKLIKRTVYPEHQKLLSARQDELVWELKEIADEGFGKTKEDYQKSLEVWERKQQDRLKAGVGTGAGATSTEGTPTMHETSLPPPSQAGGGAGAGADSSMELDGIGTGIGIGSKDKDRDRDGAIHSSQHMPVQRFRLNERMKNIIWELVVLCNESVRIENEKNTLENSTVQVSDQGARKVLYQKIVAAFPEGWMNSSQISREVSVMKKRYEAQQAEGVS